MEDKEMKFSVEKIKCNNCQSEELQRIDGLYALTKIEKNEQGITFMPASGIPIVVYVCSKCGELKLIPAKFLGEI